MPYAHEIAHDLPAYVASVRTSADGEWSDAEIGALDLWLEPATKAALKKGFATNPYVTRAVSDTPDYYIVRTDLIPGIRALYVAIGNGRIVLNAMRGDFWDNHYVITTQNGFRQALVALLAGPLPHSATMTPDYRAAIAA